jgi:Tfp pilus assembly protein PilO
LFLFTTGQQKTGAWSVLIAVGILVLIACIIVMIMEWRFHCQQKKEQDSVTKTTKSATHVMAMFLASMSHGTAWERFLAPLHSLEGVYHCRKPNPKVNVL